MFLILYISETPAAEPAAFPQLYRKFKIFWGLFYSCFLAFPPEAFTKNRFLKNCFPQ